MCGVILYIDIKLDLIISRIYTVKPVTKTSVFFKDHLCQKVIKPLYTDDTCDQFPRSLTCA